MVGRQRQPVPAGEEKQTGLQELRGRNSGIGSGSADGNQIAQRVINKGLSEFEEEDEDAQSGLEGIVGAARAGAGDDDDEFDF